LIGSPAPQNQREIKAITLKLRRRRTLRYSLNRDLRETSASSA
jgi:hypothetical protein